MYKIIVDETEAKKPAEMSRRRMEDKFKDGFNEKRCQSVDWTDVAQGTDRWWIGVGKDTDWWWIVVGQDRDR